MYDIKQSSINGGVFSIDHETGEITVNNDMLESLPVVNEPNFDKGDGVYIIRLYFDGYNPITDADILVKVPWGFEVHLFIHDYKDTIIIIERDPFLMHGKEDEVDGQDQ